MWVCFVCSLHFRRDASLHVSLFNDDACKWVATEGSSICSEWFVSYDWSHALMHIWSHRKWLTDILLIPFIWFALTTGHFWHKLLLKSPCTGTMAYALPSIGWVWVRSINWVYLYSVHSQNYSIQRPSNHNGESKICTNHRREIVINWRYRIRFCHHLHDLCESLCCLFVCACVSACIVM